jgi:hypothetical protein
MVLENSGVYRTVPKSTEIGTVGNEA